MPSGAPMRIVQAKYGVPQIWTMRRVRASATEGGKPQKLLFLSQTNSKIIAHEIAWSDFQS